MHESLLIDRDEVIAVPLDIGLVAALRKRRARVVEPAVMRLVIVSIPDKHSSFHRKDQMSLRLVKNRSDNDLRPVPSPRVLGAEGKFITELLEWGCPGKGVK